MKKLLTALLMITAISGSLLAGGFQINDQSARSVGMGFSTVANINDPSSIFYNPAAMVDIPGDLAFSVGACYIMPGAKFTGITTLNQNNTTPAEAWNFLIPNVYAAWKTPMKGLSFGVGFFAPFGLGSRWPNDWVGKYAALETYMQTLELNPNLAYNFDLAAMNVSVSAGFGYAMGNVEMKQLLSTFTPNPLLDLKGSGNGTTYNFGLNVGIMKNLKFGASYRHNIEIEYSGDVTYENITGLEGMFQATTGKTKIKFPSDLRIGLALELMKDLWIEAGINSVGWSSYDTLKITFDKMPGNPATSYTKSTPRLYKDAMIYRIAGEYKYSDNLTLRLGCYYDPLAVDVDHIEPVLPEGNRIGVSFGIGYSINKMLSFDLGYLGIIGSQAEVNKLLEPGQPGYDPNKPMQDPSAMNGYYNTWANVLALSLNVHL